MGRTVVVGSINVDMVFTSDIRPKAGETVIGKTFSVIPGGKGANQAVAASRLGSESLMVGCVGNDSNGKFSIRNLGNMNVGTDGIEIIEGIPTGVAGIVVAENDNSIIVIPGSNNMVTKEVIDKHRDIILSSNIVLLQLEIPMETVEYTAKLCSENNIKVILNPAPAAELSTNLIEDSTYITPNEHELGIIAGKFNDMDEALREYPNKMIVTLGSKGVKYFDGIEIKSIPAYPANVVDTTGAGDTFCGALAASLVEGNGLEDSVKFANKAAALATTKLGAQSGMPTIEEMEIFN